jgi:hypothetical protein
MKEIRREKLEAELGSLETEYRQKLIAALQECINGHVGLLGQNDHLDLPGNLRQNLERGSGATELFSLGKAIEELRHRLGIFEPFALHAKFLAERGRQNANRPGETKLAKAWLDDLARQKP